MLKVIIDYYNLIVDPSGGDLDITNMELLLFFTLFFDIDKNKSFDVLLNQSINNEIIEKNELYKLSSNTKIIEYTL